MPLEAKNCSLMICFVLLEALKIIKPSIRDILYVFATRHLGRFWSADCDSVTVVTVQFKG